MPIVQYTVRNCSGLLSPVSSGNEDKKTRKLEILSRSKFLRFDELRKKNREIAEVDIEKADYDLIRFEELANSLNDKFAIRFRYDTICKYVLPQLILED